MSSMKVGRAGGPVGPVALQHDLYGAALLGRQELIAASQHLHTRFVGAELSDFVNPS
jgi:hypothetical protein